MSIGGDRRTPLSDINMMFEAMKNVGWEGRLPPC
jgi:hypothetical protein